MKLKIILMLIKIDNYKNYINAAVEHYMQFLLKNQPCFYFCSRGILNKLVLRNFCIFVLHLLYR